MCRQESSVVTVYVHSLNVVWPGDCFTVEKQVRPVFVTVYGIACLVYNQSMQHIVHFRNCPLFMDEVCNCLICEECSCEVTIAGLMPSYINGSTQPRKCMCASATIRLQTRTKLRMYHVSVPC